MRVISQFHENPRLIAAWQHTAGPAPSWLTPERRRTLLLIGSVVVLLRKPARTILDSKTDGRPDAALFPVIALLLLGSSGSATRRRNSTLACPKAVQRRPQLTLHTTFWAMMAGLWMTSGATGAWRTVFVGLAILLPFVIWRFAYMLLSAQRGKMAGTRFRDHLIYVFPLWGGGPIPYGKGLDYLSRCEARTTEDLARAQLAGGQGDRARHDLGCGGQGNGRDDLCGPGRCPVGPPGHGGAATGAARQRRWPGHAAVVSASIYCELVRDVLELAGRGHVVVGILRLFGLTFPQHLQAAARREHFGVLEPVFYYYKEMLSELFFMPVFRAGSVAGTGCDCSSRSWQRPDSATSTTTCSRWTNCWWPAISRGCGSATDRARSTACCSRRASSCRCSGNRRGEESRLLGLHRRVIRIAGVWTFFGLIYIWHGNYGADPWARTQFLLHLFGLAST